MKKELAIFIVLFQLALYCRSENLYLSFFGSDIILAYPEELMAPDVLLKNEINGKCILDYYRRTEDKNYSTFLDQLTKIKQLLNLDDFGFALFVNDFTDKLVAQPNQRVLLRWYIYKKLGYDVVLYFSKYDAALYGKSRVALENSPYFQASQNEYYIDLSFKEKEVVSRYRFYDEERPDSTRLFILDSKKIPDLGEAISKKKLVFRHKTRKYTVNLNYNRHLLNYIGNLPRLQIGKEYMELYSETETIKSLLAQLHEIVDKKDTIEGINTLLSFCQTLEYKDDDEVYGFDKTLSPVETVCSSFSDCEDRTLLFAFLVHRIYNVKSILLFYKDMEHINAGILLNNPCQNFDIYSYEGRPFSICEPNGRGYPVGVQARKLKNSQDIEVVLVY